ncbi:MAG TPA: secretin N-terminal domain-containing protein, partial [Thermoguttaceae bacterium]|nr:secretin N-terminal domain-containing protein [Thermoguttaceae bacterium]
IAVAVAADQEVIRKTMERLVPDRPEKYPEAQFYPLAHASPSVVVEVINKSVPKALVAMEASGNRLMAVANDYEHKQIAEIVQRMEREVFVKGQNKLVVYPVTLAQRKRFEAVLDTLKSELPGTRVVEGAEPGELAVWARPRQHEVLVEILEELKRDVPNEEKFGLIAYPTYTSEPADIVEALQNVFPDTKLIADEPNRRVLVWSYPSQHEAIKQALEQLLPQQAATGTRVLRAYPFPYAADQPAPAGLTRSDYRSSSYRSSRYSTSPPPPPAASPDSAKADGLLAALKQLVPQAELSLDAKNQLLIALATPEDHEVLKATLEQIEAEIPGQEKPQLEIYTLADSDAAKLIPLLQPLVPEARLSVDSQSGNLLAFATSDDHTQLKAALEKLAQSPDLADTPQLQVYHLSQADPQSALNLLQNLVPKAQITVDTKHDVLVVIARLADQALIKAALDELESVLPAETPRFDVYEIGNADAQKLVASLQPMVPDARLTVDEKTKSLFAWCTDAEHTMLADVLAKLLPGGLASEEPVLRVYPFPYVAESSSAAPTKSSKNRPTELPTSLVATLQQVAPEAKITIDSPNERLIVMASPAEHMQIAAALAQLETEPPAEPQLKLATYQLQSADIEAVETMIESLFPDCQVVVDKRANRLSVWADTEQQQAIAEAVQQMDTGVPVDRQEKVMVYPISKADPTVAIGVLQEMVPEARLQADATAGTIIAWARPEDHETIRQVIQQMQVPG